MSELANELRALCVDECRNRIDYRCVVCRGADAVERLAAAEAAMAELVECGAQKDAAIQSYLEERSHLTARLAAAEARNATGTCRILSGECDCTLCKQDTKIAELSGKVGELEKLVKRLTEESLQSSIRNGAIIADFEDAVEYMVHLTECDIHDYPTSRGCTCGLEELRKRLAAAKAKGGRDGA